MEGGWKQQVMLRRGVKGDGGLVKVFYRWFEISLADESGPQGRRSRVSLTIMLSGPEMQRPRIYPHVKEEFTS